MLRRIVPIAFMVAVFTVPPATSATGFGPDRPLLYPHAAAQDTNRLPEGHSPEGALWRGAVLPGWGQWYNRQYYKIPIVYLGFGGLVVTTLNLHDSYTLHRRALFFDYDMEEYAHFENEWRELQQYFDQGRADLVRQQRDALRRNRDLMVLLTGAWWALSVVEAYVSAHLLDFDVGEDLSLSVHPSAQGVTARFKIDL